MKRLVIAVAVLCLLAQFALMLLQSRRDYHDCAGHIKNIGTALEMYSTDNKGQYPPSLYPLMTDYLKSIPTCPVAHRDTYSATYTLQQASKYIIQCSGDHHPGIWGKRLQFHSIC